MSNISKRFSVSIRNALEEASRRCFDNLPIVPYRTGTKLLRRKPIGPMATNHYIPELRKSYKSIHPEFTTEKEERRIESMEMLRRRGKAPPKKGQGKRATKGKKWVGRIECVLLCGYARTLLSRLVCNRLLPIEAVEATSCSILHTILLYYVMG